MPTLLLIRHGENDYLKSGILVGNTPGIPLNDRGREQASLIKDCLVDLPIKAIYSSPIQRAVETAMPLAVELKMEIRIETGLADTNVGNWAGKKLKELRKLPDWKQVQANPSRFQFPGGESFIDLQERQVSAIENLAQAHKRKELVAIFFHADPIKLVLAHFLGLPLDNFQRLAVDTGSISILSLDKSGPRLIGMNLRPPLNPKLMFSP